MAPTLTLHAADAGDTYLAWWWDDEPGVWTARIDAAELDQVMVRLDRALLARMPGERSDDASTRAFAGAFFSPTAEAALARSLGELVLGAQATGETRGDREDLRSQLLARAVRADLIEFRVTPSPRLARVPWEILRVDSGDRRLVEVATVCAEPPAAILAERSQFRCWADAGPDAPTTYLVDPKLPAGAAAWSLGQTLATADWVRWRREMGARGVRIRSSSIIGRGKLSAELTRSPGRLFYFGHVRSAPDEPGSAALVLSDDARVWGQLKHSAGHRDAPQPLSALDLLLGTFGAPASVHERYGSSEPVAGREIWPIPPRVALIACEGGVDFRSTETFGLVIVMIGNGAELVTTTRWPLPTDKALRESLGIAKDDGPTCTLALEVDRCHGFDDPVHAFASWQRDQLRRWRDSGGAPQYSPLLWASIVHTVA